MLETRVTIVTGRVGARLPQGLRHELHLFRASDGTARVTRAVPSIRRGRGFCVDF
jgi:hypothetical protein